MLVLTVRENDCTRLTLTEALPAGTEIQIVLMEIDGNKTRIGFEAPREIQIVRQQLWQKQQAKP